MYLRQTLVCLLAMGSLSSAVFADKSTISETANARETVTAAVNSGELEGSRQGQETVLQDSDIKPRVYDSDISDMLPAQQEVPPVEPITQGEEPVGGTDGRDRRKQQSSAIADGGDDLDEADRAGQSYKDWLQKQDHWGIDGLRFSGRYGLIRMKLGGRAAVDIGILRQDHSLESAYPDFEDNTAELRTAQLQVVGNFGPHTFFKVQFEGASTASVGLKDAYVVLQDIPLISNIRLGQGKEPFSLENLTSFKFNTFMERSLAAALAPGRSFGAMAYSAALSQRMTWATRVFYRSAHWGDLEFDTSGGVDVALRLTGLPIYEADDKFFHVGFSAVRRNFASDLEISSSPESRMTDTRYVDTGSFDANTASIFNLEALWERGPLTVQGEYTRSYVSADSTSPQYTGGYIQLGYFLTGEHRPYNKAAATFGEVEPLVPLSRANSGVPGAWELALRFSALDLDSGSNPGGIEHNMSLGMNWYPGHKIRVMLNYVTGDVDSLASGRFHILQARVLYAL